MNNNREGYWEFLEDMSKYNLCTYYILPLLGISKFDFGDHNFRDSYINRAGEHLTVKVVDKNLMTNPHTILSCKYMVKQWEMDNGYYYCFNIPHKYLYEVECYLAGKYSHFRESAKEVIKEHSGLQWKVYSRDIESGKDKYDTSPILLALYKDPLLREYWTHTLKTYVLDANDELISPPGERTFLEVEIEE